MRIITLAIAFLIGINAEAQVIRAEPFYIAPEEAAVVANLLLDSFPGAAVAYSLRKLDKDYTGSAIRVRRSSDNTEQDIGFVNNYLDTAAMKTFVGANNGFVVTWYNQADSSGVFGVRNANQTTAAAQPQIIASGAIIYGNGICGLDFLNDYFLHQHSFTMKPATLFITAKVRDLTRNMSFYGAETNSGLQFRLSSTGRQSLVQARVAVIGTATNANSTNMEIMSSFFKSNGEFAFFNNATANGSGTNNLTIVNSLFSIGANASTSTNESDWILSEYVIYNSDNSANRAAIVNNTNAFYSIY